MGAFVLMARGARVDGDGAARARVLPVKTPSRTSLSLLPQPPSSASTDAPQPMFFFVPPGCCDGRRARARSRFFAVRRLSADVSRLLLASAAPAGPRYGRRQDAQGAAQPVGAKHSGRFPTSAAATLCWEEVLWLLPRLERALTAPLHGFLVAYGTLALDPRRVLRKLQI